VVTPSYCECALHVDIPKWLRNMSTIVPKWLRNMSTHEFAGKIIHHEIFISCFPRSKMWNCELCRELAVPSAWTLKRMRDGDLA